MSGCIRPLALWLVGSAVLVAQGDPFVQLELRVSSLRPGGACVVDRGARDQVQVGDRVVLTPRLGPTLTGRVTELDERTALVELLDPTAVVPVGTRGHVLLPKALTTGQAEPAPAPRTAPDPGPPAVPVSPRRPPPGNTRPPGRTLVDPDDWQPGMPLLGMTRPPQPQERAATVDGRLYAATNVVRTLDSWSQSYLTTGADVDFGNLTGDGGTLRFHGDFNWSTETSDQTGTDLRLYELSYERGGTRFQPWHLQLGRFLPRDLPEFGLLDGVAVGHRRENGDRFGGSLGYLPELDEDLESFADLQVAAWYVWNQDVAERVSLALGYQKSWHRWDPDRDLVVARWRYLPQDGFDVSGTVWVDFYSSSDERRANSVDISRANALLARRWEQVGGIELFYDHEQYPDLRRRELLQTIQPATLADAHQDRLSLHAFVWSGQKARWFTRLTGWVDEERTGGAAEVGVELTGLWQQRARTTFAGFQVQGLTSALVGVRMQHGGSFGHGRLDALYELGFVHHEGFLDDRDDLLQHRLAGQWSGDIGFGCDLAVFADGTWWDEELSFGLGLYLQKHF